MNETYIYQDSGRDKIISIALTEKEKSTEEKVEVNTLPDKDIFYYPHLVLTFKDEIKYETALKDGELLDVTMPDFEKVLLITYTSTYGYNKYTVLYGDIDSVLYYAKRTNCDSAVLYTSELNNIYYYGKSILNKKENSEEKYALTFNGYSSSNGTKYIIDGNYSSPVDASIEYQNIDKEKFPYAFIRELGSGNFKSYCIVLDFANTLIEAQDKLDDIRSEYSEARII